MFAALIEDLAALRRRHGRPRRLRRLGRGNRLARVVRAGFLVGRDGFAGVGRVSGLERGAVARPDPLAADQIFEGHWLGRLAHLTALRALPGCVRAGPELPVAFDLTGPLNIRASRPIWRAWDDERHSPRFSIGSCKRLTRRYPASQPSTAIARRSTHSMSSQQRRNQSPDGTRGIHMRRRLPPTGCHGRRRPTGSDGCLPGSSRRSNS